MPFESSFSQAADAYETFRPEYPAELFEKILAVVPAERRHRAMDLGAGTGLSALPLCRWFAEVIAVEPDARMASKLDGLDSKILVRKTTAEDCLQPPESMDLVTVGTAFYWMDGPRVLGNVRAWLRPQGALAVYRYRFPRTPDAINAILREEFERHWDGHRHDRLRDEDYSRRTIATALGFADLKLTWMRNGLELAPAALVGFLRSTSYVSAYLRTLPDPEAYLAELGTRFRQAHPQDTIPVAFDLELLLARRE